MKKNLNVAISLFILIASACQQDSFLDDKQRQGTNASNLTNYECDINVSLATAKYTAELMSHSKVKSITPIVPQPHDTIMYVVNCEKGWMLLSADKRVTPILASSPSGEFNQNSTNPGVATLLNSFADKLTSMKQQGGKATFTELKKNENFMFWLRMTWGAANKDCRKTTSSLPSTRCHGCGDDGNIDTFICKRLVYNSVVEEKVNQIGQRTKTVWGQDEPWNTNLPLVLDGKEFTSPPVGCVAVAMAQLLYFTHFKFNVPNGLNHGVSFTGRIIDKDNYTKNYVPGHYVANSPRWNEMALYWAKPCRQTSYVADLMAELGYYLGMNYSPTESGTNVSTEVMRRYGIAWDEGDYDANMVMQSIEKGCPVLITAFEERYRKGWLFWRHTHYRGGHAWLIDGIVNRHRSIRSEYQWEPVIVDHTKGDVEPTLGDYEEVLHINAARASGIREYDRTYKYYDNDTRYLLMNWGWDGDGNSLEFSPNAEIWSAGGHNYRYNKRIYFNVRPLNK